MAREVELKLGILESSDSDILMLLENCLGISNFTRFDLHNTYYDTSELGLNTLRVALRIRKKEYKYIQTLKTKGSSVNGLHQRGEWEWVVDQLEINSTHLETCEAWPSTIDSSLLSPVFETNFARHQTELDWEGARIELAVDLGMIIAIDNKSGTALSAPIREIELELLQGEPKSLVTLGHYLQEEMQVETYDTSKAERGYRLFKEVC